MSALLTMAYDSSNQFVHIDSVKRGIACQCHCPDCNNPLYAKNGGSRREHHFAHAHGYRCVRAYETALHLLAKQIIQEQECLMLPVSGDKNKPYGLVKLKNVKVERWDDVLNIKPDAEGILSDGRRLLIEFLVTHKVDNKKYHKIIDNNMLCVEIDLNYLKLEKEAIREYLTQETEGKRWIVKTINKKTDGYGSSYTRNPQLNKVKDLLKHAFENKKITIRRSNDYGVSSGVYNLSDFGYVRCVVDAKFRGFKCDLLLSRNINDDNFISINCRGRRRNQGKRLPKDLRNIDIIISRNTPDEIIASYSEGYLDEGVNNIIFSGKWKSS